MAWTLEALKGHGRVAVAALEQPQLDALNRSYGTSLGESDFELRTPLWFQRQLTIAAPRYLRRLQLALLYRQVSGHWDVIISTNEDLPPPRPGIQYIHGPGRLDPMARDMPRRDLSARLLRLYHLLCDRIANRDPSAVERSLILANSHWTACELRRLNPALDIAVVPPPVAGPGRNVPWEQRINAFLWIGRMSPEKELEKAIAIVAGVRQMQPDVRLHMLVAPSDSGYEQHVAQLVAKHDGWVVLHRDLSHQQRAEMIATHRWGINTCTYEAFGIAAAEMVRGGCIVFVPNSGGQVEIVGADDRLVYDGPEDAVRKIVRTMQDPVLQASLRADLALKADLFSAERFMESIRGEVMRFAGIA